MTRVVGARGEADSRREHKCKGCAVTNYQASYVVGVGSLLVEFRKVDRLVAFGAAICGFDHLVGRECVIEPWSLVWSFAFRRRKPAQARTPTPNPSVDHALA